MEIPSLLPGAEPFFHRGNAVGVLVLHGFTASPEEVRPLCEYLAVKRDFTVYAPRLTHHGTQAADMNRSQWWDWYFAALDAYYVLAQQCEKIMLVGLSMGGATAMLLAAQTNPHALVVCAAPAEIERTIQTRLAGMVWPVKKFSPKLGSDDITDPVWAHRYKVYPLHAIPEMIAYVEIVEQVLPQVTAPAFLIHAENDEVVPFHNMDTIVELLGSARVDTLPLHRGGHLILWNDYPERPAVFAAICEFIDEHAV